MSDFNWRDLVWIAFAYRRLIALVAFVFLGFGIYHCMTATKIYEAVITVRVPQASNSAGSDQTMSYLQGGDQMETDLEICQSGNVALRVFDELQLDKRPNFQHSSKTSLINGLLNRISASNILKSDIISIRAQDTNPQFAADLANAWADGFIQAELDLAHEGASARRAFLEQQVDAMKARLDNPDLKLNEESKTDETVYEQLLENLRQARIAESNESLGVVVVDKALPPDGPVKPNKKKILEISLLLGLFFGFQLAWLLDWLADKVRNLDRLKRVTDLPNYAVVPDLLLEYPAPFGPGGVSGPKLLIHDPAFENSSYLESFRVLRTNLTYAPFDKPLKIVTVLSPEKGEGKTLVNANLALSLAQVGKKVLLVDADLRQPSLGKLFGVEPKGTNGLPAALSGQGAWKSMIVSPGIENLDLLPNRTLVPNATELLSGEPMKRFIEETKKVYDYVVFDGAPVLGLTDSLILAALVDGVFILARWNKTRTAKLKKTMEELASVSANVVGTIFNAVGAENAILALIQPRHFYGQKSPSAHPQKESQWKKSVALAKKKLAFLKWFLP